MMAIAFSMNQAQIDMLRDVFCEIDKDHSGTLDKMEFKEAIGKTIPLAEADQVRERSTPFHERTNELSERE